MKSLDKVTCVWKQLKPLADPNHGFPCSRSSHGLSCVLNGTQLFLYGGEHVARTPLETEPSGWMCLHKDTKWQWQKLTTPSTNYPPYRVAHAQAVHKDRDVYIFGGRQGITMEEKAMNDLWKFDCQTKTWTNIVSKNTPPEPRSFHQMVCIQDSLYVFGGCGAHHGRLADLHRFDLVLNEWHALGVAPLLRGRGGANLLILNSGKSLGIVAGFAGEETNDGQVYNVSSGTWNDSIVKLNGMRKRSVCVSGSFTNHGIALIVGGEVNPSDRGHEGAGGFENDIVVLEESTGTYVGTMSAAVAHEATTADWPQARGWSNADTHQSDLYVFGGLTGNDQNPQRLDDVWQCHVTTL